MCAGALSLTDKMVTEKRTTSFQRSVGLVNTFAKALTEGFLLKDCFSWAYASSGRKPQEKEGHYHWEAVVSRRVDCEGGGHQPLLEQRCGHRRTEGGKGGGQEDPNGGDAVQLPCLGTPGGPRLCTSRSFGFRGDVGPEQVGSSDGTR